MWKFNWLWMAALVFLLFSVVLLLRFADPSIVARFPLVRLVLVNVSIFTSFALTFTLISLYGFYSGELEHIENSPYRSISALGLQAVAFALLLLALILGINQSWSKVVIGDCL